MCATRRAPLVFSVSLRAPMPAARPRAAAKSSGGAMPLLRGVSARLLDPRDRAAAVAVAVALCCAEAALCALIIRRVPYTEIDWEVRPPRVPSRLAGADARLLPNARRTCKRLVATPLASGTTPSCAATRVRPPLPLPPPRR